MSKARFSLLMILALTLVLGWAAPGLAEDTQGKMVAVLEDQKSFTMRDDGGNEHTFQLSADARLEINGEERTLADVKSGDELIVTWEEKEGRRIATIVNCRR